MANDVIEHPIAIINVEDARMAKFDILKSELFNDGLAIGDLPGREVYA